MLFTKILVSRNYIYYKIFVLLFCSLFILACSNDVSAPTTNITDVALHSLERSVNTKEGATFRFVFELNKASIKDVIFDWSVQHHSTSADDFTGALAGTKRIIAGSTTTDIVIDTSDDNIYEGNEGFTLSIINVIRAVPDSLSVVASIIDKDQPIILFKQDNTALEAASFNYRLRLNKASIKDVVFDWSVQHHSTSSSDFTGALIGTKMIRAGSTTTDIVIDTSDDSVYEGDEDFRLNIINITGAVPNSLVASGRITDNDPQPTIVFEQIARSVLEGANFVYRLQLNQASAVNVSFDWSVQHISTSSSDFTGALAGTKRIRAGSTTTDIVIDTSDDSVYEGDEDFSLNITNITGAVPNSIVASGRITDNDPQPTIFFEQIARSVLEGANFVYRLQLNQASAVNVSFDWYLRHSSTSSSDFTGALIGTKRIIAGSTTTDIVIDTSDDTIYEGDEDFSLNITNITGAVPNSLVASGRITDNDPQPTIVFEQIARSVLEGANFVYRLQLNQASAVNVSFDWYLRHSSTSSSDFTGALIGTKRIIAGSTTTDIVIDTSDDTIYEGDEDFILNITNITGATPDALVAGGSIIDTDVQPTIDFEQDYSSVTEGGSLSYTLRLTNTSTRDIAFDWSVQHSSTSTSDFRGALAGSQLIRAGSTTTDIVIDTSDDTIYEGNEEFMLNIINVTGATPDALVASGSIIDTDVQPTIDFEQDYSSVTESGSLSYTLRLTNTSTRDIAFDWYLRHSSTSTSDFTGALAGSQLIRAGDATATISIDTGNDTIYEGNEDFTLHITNITGATPDALVAGGSIIDNDVQPTIDFEQDYSSVTEGGSLSYTLRLTNTSTRDIAFDWSVRHSSTITEDFTSSLRGTKQIRAGSTTATISIDTSADSLYEGDEEFMLNITNITGATPDALAASGSIINNDPQPSITFEQDYSSITEGSSLSYTLQLNKVSALDVSFDWHVQHSSTSASDFRGALVGSQRITAGSTTTTISIDTSDDTIYEGDEEFILNITNITGATTDALAASGSIIENDPQPSITFEQDYSSVTEGGSLSYTLQLNKASAVDVNFDWHVQHSSTSVEDFRGATFGAKILFARDTTATIELQINDDDRPELTEDFTLHITNIRGATPDSLSTLITIAESDIGVSVDYDGNGLIDLVTQEYFDNIRYNVAGTSYKTSTVDTGKNCGGNVCRGYELLANLDLSSFANWQPIGSTSDPFTSTLQGNGYSITNLAINGGYFATDDRDYLGLFATLSGATIDNLVVEVTSISGNSYVGALAGSAANSIINKVQIRAANTNSKLSATGANIGGILGEITDATITNVTSDLNIVGGNKDSADYVGGIAGYVSSSDISHVYSSGSVSASGGADRVGGLVGFLRESTIDYSSASGIVSSGGSDSNFYGGLVGELIDSTISYSSASGSVSNSGANSDYYGGLVGCVWASSTISYSSASGSVSNSRDFSDLYGGLVGDLSNSTISYSSASGSVSSNGSGSYLYGGLVGRVWASSTIDYSSASGSVSSNGIENKKYGGLVGSMNGNSTINYSSASGSVSSSGIGSDFYGGLVGEFITSTISYSSASGSVTSSGANSDYYGGLAGFVDSSSAINNSSASGGVSSSGSISNAHGGLVGSNSGNLGFSYALGVAPYGLVAINSGTIIDSYWNSETSGALEAASRIGVSANIASSDTVGMLDSTGSVRASVFTGFFDATDELNRKIWTFTSGNYPVIAELGIDEQAVALAYGLLRLAYPTTSDGLDSFLGDTLNNENIELTANSYNANDTLAILDVNLLQSNSAPCVVGSTDSTLTTTGANQAVITLSITTESSNLLALIFNTDCSIVFDSAAAISAGDRLQLAATITKGSANLTKKFVINFQ